MRRTLTRILPVLAGALLGAVVAVSVVGGSAAAPTILNTEKVERAIERSSLEQRDKVARVELPLRRAPGEGPDVHLCGSRRQGHHAVPRDPARRRRPRALRSLLMIRRLTGLLVVAATMTAGASTASASPAPRQELAALLAPHRVAASPGAGSSGETLRGRRPITLGQTVVPVVGHRAKWLKVKLPGRPNGHTGWIRKRGTVRTTTRWHLVVSPARRRVLVYSGGRLRRSFTAIVGAPATPTPRGRFFVEESVQMLPGAAGGPFALALSARSNVLQEFEGGPGQIALHGVDNLGGTFGTASSHGCVRLTGPAIRWLAARITPGVPVTIRR